MKIYRRPVQNKVRNEITSSVISQLYSNLYNTRLLHILKNINYEVESIKNILLLVSGPGVYQRILFDKPFEFKQDKLFSISFVVECEVKNKRNTSSWESYAYIGHEYIDFDEDYKNHLMEFIKDTEISLDYVLFNNSLFKELSNETPIDEEQEIHISKTLSQFFDLGLNLVELYLPIDLINVERNLGLVYTEKRKLYEDEDLLLHANTIDIIMEMYQIYRITKDEKLFKALKSSILTNPKVNQLENDKIRTMVSNEVLFENFVEFVNKILSKEVPANV